jgi:hypothetical protein
VGRLHSAGQKAGTSVIQQISDGCGILENWTGTRGVVVRASTFTIRFQQVVSILDGSQRRPSRLKESIRMARCAMKGSRFRARTRFARVSRFSTSMRILCVNSRTIGGRRQDLDDYLRFQIRENEGRMRAVHGDSFAAGQRDRLCRLMCGSASRFRPHPQSFGASHLTGCSPNSIRLTRKAAGLRTSDATAAELLYFCNAMKRRNFISTVTAAGIFAACKPGFAHNSRRRPTLN